MAHRPKLRKLGNTGLEVSELTLGTWGLCAESYGPVFPEQREQTIARAIDAGITTFDMAPSWGPEGLSERAVAAGVGAAREQVVYVTRAGVTAAGSGPELAFSAAQLRESCEQSLGRLHTDRIDVWLLHNPSEDQLRSEEVVGTAEALTTEGKIRAWGAAVTHLEAARAAIEVGAQVLSLPYNLMSPNLWSALEHECTARNVAVFAHSVLLYGLLSGRYGPKKRFSAGDHRAHRWSREALEERVRLVGTRRALVRPQTLTLAAFSLRFVLSHPEIASTVIGPRTPGQVDAACLALDPTGTYLSRDELSTLRAQLA